MDHCPDCGAPVNGREACQAMWDEIGGRALSDISYGRMHTLGLDAYCMQHPAYTRSAKSYAAHLSRLCCGLEFNGSSTVYTAIRRWLDGRLSLQKPKPPKSVGSLTVWNVVSILNAEEHQRQVRGWAEDVWTAYTDQHELARLWIQEALALKPRS